MYFGFSNHQEFVPSIYKNYTREQINYIFLCQYNANMEKFLKIPFYYGVKAKNLKNIFEIYIKELLHVKFQKIIKLYKFNCFLQNIERKKLIFKENKIIHPKIENLLQFYTYGICFKTNDLFAGYVFDKICKQNPSKKITQMNNIIFIEQECAVLTLSEKIDSKNLQIEKTLSYIQEFVKNHSFDKIYIVYPKNENFTHFIQIKHFLYDLKKTMVKLVPYSITNKLIRRI